MKRILIYLFAITIFPKIISAAVLVGKTDGAFSVSPTGAATYTIPIKVQNGLSDFSPSISLTYSSQAGNGIAGMGFSISGLSAISIVPRSVYFDGQAEAIYTGEDNAFTLDGQRLLLKEGQNGQTGATYRTENEQYSLISITNSANGTPATFQVKTTNGSTYKYGNSSGRLTLNNGEAYQWALDYAEDVLGNYIQYTYAQEGVLYPTSITYGRNIHGTAGVDCTIQFNYESRSDSVPVYLHGELHFLKKRLKSIVCKYSGNIYRTYTLNYTEDVFSHLISVSETGTSSASVPPTTFEWEVPSEFQLSCSSRSMEKYPLEDQEKEVFFSGDLDGDGITEIISMEVKSDNPLLPVGTTPNRTYITGRKWNPENQRFDICFGLDTWAGYEMPGMFETQRSGSLLMHVNHSKENSIVIPFCRIFENQSKNCIFSFPQEGVNLSIPMKGLSKAKPCFVYLDANKDGLDDIFIIEKEKKDGHYPAYLVYVDLITASFTYTELSLNLADFPTKIRRADFNSDGMIDLFISTSKGYYIYWNRNGNFSDEDRYHGTEFKSCDIIELGDFNGDGLPDLIIKQKDSTHTLITNPYVTHWYIALNSGDETNGYFSLQEVGSLSGVGARESVDNLYCLVQDIDADGKSDVIVGAPVVGDAYDTDDKGSRFYILRSVGDTLSLESNYYIANSKDFPNYKKIVQGNFDGGTGVQILYHGKGLDQESVGWHKLWNPTIKPSSQKIISITDGLGARDSISYGLLTDEDVYSISNHHTFPLIPMAGAFPVVKTRTESISTESRSTNYSYANGIVHLQGKGFLGFEDIKTESSTGIVTETHCVLDSTFYVLMPETVTQKNASNTIITQEYSIVNLQNLDSRSYTINNNTHHETRMPLDGFSEGEDCENFEYGFPTYQFTDDYKFTTEKEFTYWECPLESVWLKGLPEEVNITNSGYLLDGDDIHEKITYERAPSTGLILKETRKRNDQLVSTDGYSYNEYGQMTRHYTVAYNSTDTLVSRYEYDSYGRLKKEYDPKGQYRLYNYNSTYGTLISIRDFDGVVAHYAYDGFLRETKRYTNIETCQTVRLLSSYAGAVYSIKEINTGKTPTTVYYDAWERKIAESVPLANGTMMYTDYQYLPNGKVGFVSFPHKNSEPTAEGTTYTYDNVQRLVSTVDTNGKTSTWSYAAGQVTSCADGITTTAYYYNKDKVAEVNDAAGWIVYDYNADKNISHIGSADADAYYTYDTYGRLTQTTDMNGVTKQYSYDANGNPYRTTIAGNYVETNYDKFGILRSKSWADSGEVPQTVTYTYDNKFRLTKESGTGYQNTYSYDLYGRVTQKNRRVTAPQNISMSVSLQYGSDNHVSSTTSSFNNCPTTVTEYFSYRNGYKTHNMLNDSITVWQMVSQDRWGNVTEESDFLGTTTNSFDDYGNMLSMNRSGYHPVSESYTYDIQTGNMTSKNGVPLTYDNMNQLTGYGDCTYSYDDKGNITSQPSVGDFTYDGFRVTDMSADNNYTIDDSLRISYYKAIERPKSIENEHYKAEFEYDGNGDRIMMTLYEKRNGRFILSSIRYYLDANAEITDDTHNHYTHLYYAGGDAYTAPAAMVLDRDGNSSIYQITRDNIGSVLLYANASGVCYENTYSPWGVRTYRVGNNSYFYQPGVELANGPFYRTYTGHEDLWMFGLLNANARLYSPYLGRFISPDPLLNSEGGPLDYNPYIYARNNPYKYIDRNGEFWWLVAPAILGGFTSAFANFDCINSIGDFFANYGPSLLASGTGTVAGIAVGGFVTAGCASMGIVTLAPVITAVASGAAVYLTYNCVYSACTGTPFNFSWNDLGKDVCIAMVTAGIGVIASKLPKLSKIMQSRHKPIMTGPDAMAAKAEAGKAITPSAEASGIAKEMGMQARQSSAAMHSNAGLLERTGKSVTTFTGEVYISKSDPHYLELLKEAQARYPKKAGHMQWHHVDPKYMGGPSNGKLIQIDAAYHQMITNEFRSHHPFGTKKLLNESVRRGIMQEVYMKYPLPQ